MKMKAIVNGDYLGKDGEEIVIPSDLLHPGARLALGRLTKNELPCEINSLILCDVEVNDEDSRGLNTTPLLFSLPENSGSKQKPYSSDCECDSADVLLASEISLN